jgi:hypothetical protein
VLVEQVLADEVGALELLPGQWAEPLVLAQLLSVGLFENITFVTAVDITITYICNPYRGARGCQV